MKPGGQERVGIDADILVESHAVLLQQSLQATLLRYAFEAFYRLQLSDELAITPDVQLLWNPALNPEEDLIWVFGLRARLAL